MFQRDVMLDGVLYAEHEVEAIEHFSNGGTTVIVRSSDGGGGERSHGYSVDQDTSMGFEEAEALVMEMDEFAEHMDGRAATIAEQDALIDSMAALLDDDQAAQVPSAYPEWAESTAYAVGDRRRYGSGLYRCLQAHTSQADWTPDVATSLWASILGGQEGSDEDVAEWVQPDSTNPYMAGDRVTHDGKTWESLVDNNVWEPGATGTEGLWQEVE